MKIEPTMCLDALAERMGDATRAEALAMREFLLAGDYVNTNDIPESEWLELCTLASEPWADEPLPALYPDEPEPPYDPPPPSPRDSERAQRAWEAWRLGGP